MWCLNDLIVSEAKTAAMRCDRAARRFSNDLNKFLLLETHTSAFGIGCAGDIWFKNAPGRISLIDMSRGSTNFSGGISTLSLLSPNAAVSFDPSIHAAIATVMASSPRGRILDHVITTLPERMNRLDLD